MFFQKFWRSFWECLLSTNIWIHIDCGKGNFLNSFVWKNFWSTSMAIVVRIWFSVSVFIRLKKFTIFVILTFFHVCDKVWFLFLRYLLVFFFMGNWHSDSKLQYEREEPDMWWANQQASHFRLSKVWLPTRSGPEAKCWKTRWLAGCLAHHISGSPHPFLGYITGIGIFLDICSWLWLVLF